jgi:predicted amidophosphoribosyltransferase
LQVRAHRYPGRLEGSDELLEETMVPVQRRWVCSACGQAAPKDSAKESVLGPGSRGAPPSCRNLWCTMAERPLSAVFAVGNYEGAFRRAIVSYKYGRDLRWAPVFGRLLHGFLERHPTWFEEYGVICPVPSFIGQGARRPWAHTELVCAEVGRLAGAEWPVERLVTKVAETEPMSAKARPVRRAIARTGLATAFTVPEPGAAQGRHILVVDDVCASGWTLLTVSRALLDAGAEEVAALVLARGVLAANRPSRSP